MNDHLPTGPSHDRRRLAAGVAVCLAVVVACAALVTADDDADLATTEPTTTATVAVERRDLTADFHLDGTIEVADQRTITHRIEGVTAAAATGSSAQTVAGSPVVSVVGASLSAETTSSLPAATTGSEPTTTSSPDAPATETTAPADPATTPTTGDPSESTTTTACPTTTSTSATTSTSTSTSTNETTTSETTTAPQHTTGDTTPTTAAIDGCTAPTTSPPDSSTSTTSPVAPGVEAGGGGGGFPAAAGGGLPSTGATQGGTAGETNSTTVTETVTSIAAAGTVVDNGDTIYTVDGRPVIALTGEVPAWRSLSIDSDPGPDVRQLEAALTSLGYDDGGDLTVDDEFDRATRAAVEAWQEGLGLDPTGEVELGDVVFVPDAAGIDTVLVGVGDRITEGDQVAILDAATSQVTASVDDEVAADVVVGLEVDLDGVPGVIDRLVSVAATDGVEIRAVINPTGTLEQDPGDEVAVRFSTTVVEDALIVPASAIASLADGSYALQLVVDGRPVAWRTVALLAESDGDVAFEAIDIAEGDLVAES